MSAFLDPIIYPGEPLPRPGSWTRTLFGMRCRTGRHVIERGTFARLAQSGGVECEPCVRAYGLPDDTSRESA